MGYFLIPAHGEDFLDLLMGPRYHVDGNQFPNPARGSGAGIGCSLYCTHVAAALHHHESRSDELLAGQHHVGGFDHGIGGFDCTD